MVISVSPCLAQRSDFRPPAKSSRRSWLRIGRRNLDRIRLNRSPQQQGHAGDWLRRYKSVPPGEQERALQSDPAFRRLPPERQQMLRQRLQHFSGLPPQQQQQMLNRMETWEHLTPEQKQQARQIHGQMQQLPPERQSMVKTAVRHLSAMPPDEREHIINSNRFKDMFSPQERDIMRGASRLPLAPPENGRPGEAPVPSNEQRRWPRDLNYPLRISLVKIVRYGLRLRNK